MPPATKSIGQVLKVLKEDFPDISISKIRFLEGEGLISPERAPSGYRRFSDHDVKRLHYILDVQKNHYLPLKVIRENLEAMDAGEQPPAAAPSQPTLPTPVAEDLPPALPPQRPAIAGKRTIHITRKELLQISGLTEATLSELEQHGLVTPRRGTAHYGRDALTIAEDPDPRVLADAILKTVSADRPSLVKRGLAVAREYSWDRTHAQTLAVYRSLADWS